MKAQVLAVGLTLVVAAAAYADTLVLKNGRRVQGVLLAVSANEIEFEDRSGLLRRAVRVPRDQVTRIEFGFDEASASDRDRGWGRDDARDADTGRPVIPRGMRERQVVVLANERWLDTGIDVREGQTVYFASGGEVRWGPRRKDGPAGERNSRPHELRPIPDRPAAALIGRIGSGQDLFFIGAELGPFRMRQSGRLYLGINDDTLEENSGNFRVTISY
jgi:hypothetical protein